LVVNLLAHDLWLQTALSTEISPNSEKWTRMIDFDPVLTKAIASPAPHPSATGYATSIFNSGLPYDAVTDLAAGILNQLLRSMKHSADLNGLKHAVEIFVRAYGD
jgi:hypothetical protein